MATDKTKSVRFESMQKSRDYVGSRMAVASSFGTEKPADSRPATTKD